MRKLIATIAMTFIATTATAASNQSEIGNPKDICFSKVCEKTATVQKMPKATNNDRAYLEVGNFDLTFKLFKKPSRLLTSGGVTIGKYSQNEAVAYFTSDDVEKAREGLEYAFTIPVSKAKEGDKNITAAYNQKAQLGISIVKNQADNADIFFFKDASWTVAGGSVELSTGKHNAMIFAAHQARNNQILVIRLMGVSKKDLDKTIRSLKRIEI
ncbi:hypothetical protein [Zooshikella ganghwensis]|uniref:Uncharacterized protein n=1 Tax=Zooshikella ganghwensis TaxID=202772 RepID=A0A4P9VEL1_9GAMM|nr:hypothetical protein [Zooshikella ganghwensis]RDH41483.1 hypothetical protein B9G39_28110 [Zooshikella ganghwensis]RDH41589.1 hypothetical protein B9G39_27975 [Zooshikella ganghwensis]